MTYRTFLTSFTAMLVLAACTDANSQAERDGAASSAQTEPMVDVASAVSGPQASYVSPAPEGFETAIFAGGCFWCVEKDFESLPGVIEVKSGYTGGQLDNPDYETVSYTETGHYEAAEVLYNPQVIRYRDLVDYYWTTVDPTDPTGQFCDKGSSYRTAIFPTPDQMADAQASLDEVKANKPFEAAIVTPIIPAVTFYDAEDYHQDYYKKNPLRYRAYRAGCRRDATLKRLWGDQAKGGK